MKESVLTLGEFLNDFIARVVPGAMLTGMLALLFHWPIELDSEFLASFSFMLVFIAISYGMGHAIAGVHAVCVPALIKVLLAVDESAVFADLDAKGWTSRARDCLP